MTRSKRMSTIINLADNEKDLAARELAQSQQLLEQSEAQLVDMKRCRQDYAEQLTSQSSQARTVAEIKGIRVFIQQLDMTIEQLEQLNLDRRSSNEMKKNNWMKLRNKSNALADIKTRYQKSEQLIFEHKEQFESDELSQRKGD